MLGELIGKVITIRKSSNRNQIGLYGKIINETKHSFLLNTENGRKIILKRNLVFNILEKTA